MDTPNELSTEDHILFRARRNDMRSWQRTLDQVRNPEVALSQIPVEDRPFDQERD